MLFDEARIDTTGAKRWMCDDAPQQIDVADDANHIGRRQSHSYIVHLSHTRTVAGEFSFTTIALPEFTQPL